MLFLTERPTPHRWTLLFAFLFLATLIVVPIVYAALLSTQAIARLGALYAAASAWISIPVNNERATGFVAAILLALVTLLVLRTVARTQRAVRMPLREVRERGVTLIDMLAAVIILAILASQLLGNFYIEKEKANASKGVNTMTALAAKVSEYCSDSTDVCGPSLVSGSAVTLPTEYMSPIPGDPSGQAYIITLGTYPDGRSCFTIDDPQKYLQAALINIPLHSGSLITPDAATGTAYIHYDSRSGAPYQDSTASSVISGGAC